MNLVSLASLHNLGRPYVGVASPGVTLRFHTPYFVEPGGVPDPLQDTRTIHEAAHHIESSELFP